MSESAFVRSSFDLVQLAESGGSISYKVKGFWSSDVISIYAGKDYGSESFSFRISTSSGGRDTKEIEHDSDAYMNYAAALVDACDLVKWFNTEKIINEMKEAYQKYREKLKAEAEKEHQRKLQMRTDCPLVTEQVAKRLISNYFKALKNKNINQSTITIDSMLDPENPRQVTVTFDYSFGSTTQFFNHVKCTRARLALHLSKHATEADLIEKLVA